MPYKDPEKAKARMDEYNASDAGRARDARYKATTQGILVEERHYQKRKRGGSDGLEV